MLGILAKYIFGGMVGDAPETTAPQLQYHTREVNDWLLVDMPDQAIDDEDMDSESDDDEILTALPLLMAEEVIMQPLQIVQSYEDVKDYSVCDNSYKKVQQHCVDKIRTVPSAVQHHSGDKTQGNFVDNIEAVSIEVEDNFLSKIQDVSDNTKDNFNSTTHVKANIEILDASVQVQNNSKDVVQELFNDKNQCVLPEVQNSSSDENSVFAKTEVLPIEESMPNKIHDVALEIQECTGGEVQKLSDHNIFHGIVNDEIDVARKTGDKDDADEIEDDFYTDLKKLYNEFVCNEETKENSVTIETNLNLGHLENSNSYQVNSNSAPKRLYSEVVQMGAKKQNSTNSVQDTFSVEVGKLCDRRVQIFNDEIRESSDDDMNEISDDEMEKNSTDEMDENSDAELEGNTVRMNGKLYSNLIPLSSDEDSEESSDDENSDISSDDSVDVRKHFGSLNTECYKESTFLQRIAGATEEQKIVLINGKIKIVDKVARHGIGCIPFTSYEHVADFSVVPRCWYAYRTWHETDIHALCVRNYLVYEPEGFCTHVGSYTSRCLNNKRLKRRQLPIEDKPTSQTPINQSLITNSAEILQNLINQKSTILPSKTAVVLEHIKELKPVQQAIQLENRKYLTRSQLNRQNRNYIYQASVKNNRRRNLQRNHSGANNNRKC